MGEEEDYGDDGAGHSNPLGTIAFVGFAGFFLLMAGLLVATIGLWFVAFTKFGPD